MDNLSIKKIIYLKGNKKNISISAWIRNKRVSKNFSFLSLNDGTTAQNFQVVIDNNTISQNILAEMSIGASVLAMGNLFWNEKDQKNELVAEEIKLLGPSSENYPLQPKKHSMEFLRSIAHLRARTNTFGAVFRLRGAITHAIHSFFYENDFVNFSSPLITTTDGEGAGEMFTLSALNFEKKNKINFEEDFFSEKASLTVTGQLEAETAIFGLNRVYTFGPTFRAENSNTTRHLAEFWMIEPEAAFFDLNDNIALATNMLKYCIRFCLENNLEDIKFLEEKKSKENKNLDADYLTKKLEKVLNEDFQRITYSEAIEILKNKNECKETFLKEIKNWGDELQTEHEKFLVDHYFRKPVIITDYPKKSKAFYMKQNDDGKTVAAMDILFPDLGEIVGGAQREENWDRLQEAISFFKIKEESINWYLDTRKFGSVIHSGFGLGLERLVMFISGIENIRDVIPFPRTPGNARNGFWKYNFFK